MIRTQSSSTTHVIENDIGTWTIYRDPTVIDGKYVGPGYIARLRERETGLLIADDVRGPLDDGASVPDVGSLNDTYGGLGGAAIHHYRRGEDPREISTRRHRELWPHVGAVVRRDTGLAALGPEAVLLSMGLDLGPVSVAYDYHFARDHVLQWVTMTQNTDDFVAEPKVVAATNPVGGVNYTDVDVYDRGGGLLRHVELGNLGDATRATTQLNQRHRARLVWRGDPRVRGFSVTALAARAPGVAGGQWFGSRYGFDRWAKLSEGRERFKPGDDDGPRRWEIIRRKHNGTASCLFHAWENGRGIGDPETLHRVRRMVAGESWTVLLRYQLAK